MHAPVSHFPTFNAYIADHYQALTMPLMQGKVADLLTNAIRHIAKHQASFSELSARLSAYTRSVSDDDYNVDHAIALIAPSLGKDTHAALDVILFNDVNTAIAESMMAIAASRLDATNLERANTKKEWLAELKNVLIEEGGLGAQQANVCVRAFEESVKIHAEHYFALCKSSQKSR